MDRNGNHYPVDPNEAVRQRELNRLRAAFAFQSAQRQHNADTLPLFAHAAQPQLF